ncbi:MAG: hypothetical protein NT141_04585 [candidate division WWE3 bacterium]|nr:hypothetical protein [candidate division WWE3 bacterium]
MNISDRIGLDLGTLVPYSAIPLPYVSMAICASITRAAGYAFWQARPLRGVSWSAIKKTEIPVRSIEPMWDYNPRNLKLWLRYLPFRRGLDAANCFIRLAAAFPMAWQINDYLSAVVLNEINLYDRRDPAMLATAGILGQQYALDLWHIRQLTKAGEMVSADNSAVQTLILAMLPTTKIVHVQTRSKVELRRFLRGETTELGKLLREVAKAGFEGFYVVEIPPLLAGWTTPQSYAKGLRKFRESILTYFP